MIFFNPFGQPDLYLCILTISSIKFEVMKHSNLLIPKPFHSKFLEKIKDVTEKETGHCQWFAVTQRNHSEFSKEMISGYF